MESWQTLLSRYSTLPSFALTVNASPQRLGFTLLLAFATAIANYHVYIKGYPVLSIVAASVTLFLLSRTRFDQMVGSVLMWEHGEWFLEHAGTRTAVLLLPTSVRHPCVIYLDLRETVAGKRWRLWLFSDSANPEQLRKLRSRLTLEKS